MKTVRVKAPAKINLFLRVLRRRSDGYHDIETIFQALTLHDELVLRAASGKSSLAVPGHPELEHEDNLVLKAVSLLERETGHKLSVEIRLKKNIPIGGGLGGGSSDCAATMLALRKLFNLDLSDDALAKLGRSLGADVPFFLIGGTAVAEGIGELLTPVDLVFDHQVLLVNPGFPVSTARVYAEFSRTLTGKNSESTVWDVLKGRSGFEDLLENDLQRVAEGLYPVIGEIASVLRMHGLKRSLMSGSGPTVFALAEPALLEPVRNGPAARWNCMVTEPWHRGITMD